MLPSCMVDATYPRPLFSFLKLAAARPPVPQHFPLSVFGFASAPKLFRPPHLRAPFARRMRSSANLSLSFPLTPLLSIATSDKPRPKSFRMRSSEKRWGEGRLWLTNSPSTAKFRPSSIPPDQRFRDVSSFFSHSCALFCTFLHASKTQLFCFQSIPHSLPKTTGVGALPMFQRQSLSPILTSLPPYFITSSVPPSVPLQPTALGATIGKGARILYAPGKQLRSPRCLRIVSGHREPFDDVPDQTPTRSGSQVDRLTIALARRPGSTVLTLDRSRVARCPAAD